MSDLRLAALAERADTYDRPAGSPIPRHPRRRHGQPPGGGAIDLDAKANGAASRAGGQYEVEIAGMKTVGDAARGIVQRGELAADRPSAGQAPVVEQQRRYCAIDARSICGGAAGRNEVPGLVIADVGLIRAQIALIRGGLRTFALDRGDRAGDGRAVGFGQQLLDQAFRFVVTALAEHVVAHSAICADEVEPRPRFVIERPPNPVVVVDGDGIVDVEATNALLTLATSFSKTNSGVCTPITTSPRSLYFLAHSRT